MKSKFDSIYEKIMPQLRNDALYITTYRYNYEAKDFIDYVGDYSVPVSKNFDINDFNRWLKNNIYVQEDSDENWQTTDEQDLVDAWAKVVLTYSNKVIYSGYFTLSILNKFKSEVINYLDNKY